MSVMSNFSGRESNAQSEAQGAALLRDPIEVFPPEIVFRNVEPEQTYEVTVSVRNLSSKVRRMRFIPPQTSKFSAEYETQGSIAPGIQTLLVVSFETDHLGNFHDELQILSEDFAYSLKLHALEPAPEILFEPFLNLGVIPLKKLQETSIEFANEGARTGEISLRFDQGISPELVLEPADFTLQSGQRTKVAIKFIPREAGIFRCPVEVQIAGQDVQRHIDLNATCVDHQMTIVAPYMERLAPGKKHLAVTTSINFGHMYHGDNRQMQAFLVNNGPTPVKFAIKFFQGSEEELAGIANLVVTPQEQAELEMKRVMKAEPAYGEVPAYAQVAIDFECNSKVPEKAKGFIRSMMEESNQGGEFSTANIVDNIIDYFYTAVFAFQELGNSLNLQLQARAVLPHIKISQNSIFFPECAVNDRRDFIIKIENANEELPIDFELAKVAHFTVTPSKGKLMPLESKSVVFTFMPKNLGVFHSLIAMSFIKTAYKVPILVYGKATGITSKPRETRGPEAKPRDFAPRRKYASEHDVRIPERTSRTQENMDTIRTDHSLQVDQKILKNYKNQQYVDFLRQSRKKRITTDRVSRRTITAKTLEELEVDPSLGLKSGLKEKHLPLPSPHEPLYVKNLGAIEKAHDASKAVRNFTRKTIDGGKFKDVPFGEKPIRPSEVSECQRLLAPSELQLVSASPQTMIFDQVVVSTPISKWLSIVNDHSAHIWVKVSTKMPEVHSIEPASLVIPPGMRGGFKVTILSRNSQTVEGMLTYSINDSHSFNVIIRGKVEPAVLSLSKQFIHFVFDDDDMEETLCERLTIHNECSADTRFIWKTSPNYEVEPKEDVVKAFKTKTVLVKFTPSLNNKLEESNMVMQVEHGAECVLRVKGEFNEAKCNLMQRSLEFDVASVGLKVEKTFSIKNQLRSSAIYHVKKVPSTFTITPAKGKIPSEGKVTLKCEFSSSEEQKVTAEVEIAIRGGKTLILPISAQAIVPKVYIKEPELDFGGVTYKSSSVKEFSIVNESPIEAGLYISLEEHPEFDIFMPLDGNEGEAESMIFGPALSDKNDPFLSHKPQEEDEIDDIHAEEDSEDAVDEVPRTFRLSLAAHTTVKLALKFTPSDTEMYKFNLPVKMAGMGEPPKSLCRPVSGEGLLPRFLVDPSVVVFKRKYIAFGEKGFPDNKDVIFSNPDIYPLRWRLDTSGIDGEKNFTVTPAEGYLDPAGTQTVRVSFTPTQPIYYSEKLKVLLNDSTEPYLEITLEGEGALPKISFDRRQLILPIVPLGITSKATFRIANEGYQNVELKYRFLKDMGRIPVSVVCPEGLNLGATNPKLQVEIHFVSDKPLSFVTWIEFFDTDGNRFNLEIQGTTDNCLFTNFPFLQRHLDDIKIETESSGRIVVSQEIMSDNEEHWGHGVRTSKASSVQSRSARSIVGYHPIPPYLLEKGLEFLTRWISQNVFPVTRFPDDFIENHGAPLFDLIQVLSGRAPSGMVKNPGSLKPKELARQLHRQYEELIENLKKQGALLNTVRPEALLSLADYTRFLKSTPLEMQFTTKQIQHRWPYMARDAWTTLIYQVLKVYLLNRVNPRAFKGLPGMKADATNVDPPMNMSNIYCISECILLKWMNYHYNSWFQQHPRQIVNFDNDIIDGSVIAALIQSHVGPLKSLAAVKPQVTTDDQRLANCERVVTALNEIGIPSFLTGNDLARPSAREILLLILKLFNSLPHYLPKAQVVFSCPLGDTVVKKIELSNPGNRSINYWVRLEGSADYSIEGYETVTLNPKSTVEFSVYFKSRITIPVQRAKLSFTNRSSEGNAQAAALVFDLISDVKPPVQVPVLEVHSPLYKLLNKEVEVKNIYGQEAEFSIQLLPLEEGKKPAEKKGGYRRPQVTEQSSLQFPPPFFIKNEKIKVKKAATSYISLQFLPFEMRAHRAELILCDERVGELHFIVVGSVGMPEPLELPPIKAEMGDSVAISVPVDPKNKSLEYAKVKCRERYQSNQKAKEREQINEIFKRIAAEDSNVFEVSLSSPYFNGPNTLSLSDPRRMKTDTQEDTRKKAPSRASVASTVDLTSKLQLACSPRSPGEYTCTITLASIKKTDVRVYELLVQVKPKKHIITLEMTGYARSEIVQEIPITNNSEKDWTVKVGLSQDGREFTATPGFVVKKQSIGNCRVTFSPEWVCEVAAKLLLEITATGEAHEFLLKGISEEPRAEEHLTLDCKVKEQTKVLIPIANNSDAPVRYRVEADLDITEGEPSILVPPKSVEKYELAVRPIQSGIYTGAVSFYDPEERFYWYTLELRALEPEPEAEKALVVQCRKAVELKITVFNPYDEATTFEVTIQGEGLLGDNVFYVAAQETGVYELLYSPLVAGESYGSVSFISERTGEFWYKLKLTALEPEPVNLADFECELGRTNSQTVTLENPSGEEVILSYYCSNPLNFELVPEKVILPPYEVAEAQIRYSPSTLKHIETGEIRLSSKALGDWVFRMQGRGLAPGLMPVVEISATLDESSSAQVTFRNPLREHVEVTLALTTTDATFQLLVKRNSFGLGPLGVLLIPISYYPRSMEDYSATLDVSITDDLTWRYPIKGITVSPSTHIDYSFKAKCRETYSQSLVIYLTDINNLREEENFTHEINVLDKGLQNFVDKSLSIDPIKNILANSAEPLEFNVKFEPLRPFKGQVELIITKASGGRWIYKILLEAFEPDIDDVIHIESPIGKTSSVAFKLTNQFKNFAEFEAAFSPDSDACFAVQPNAGILEPFGRDGTTFIVSFTPTEYGAPKVGKLIITTDDMRWTYLIKGSHPHYQPPAVSGGRIDNKLKRQLPPHPSKKNFIRGNMKQISPKRTRNDESARSLRDSTLK